MTSLRESQRRAYRAIFAGDPAGVLPLLAGDAIPPDLQVQIYCNNVKETFRKALASSYPVVERLVGHVCFRGLSQEYLRRFPSRRGSLQQFGEKFAELLTELYTGTQYDYLPDVARLEWASEQVLAGPECDSRELRTLGAVSPAALAKLKFRFPDSIRLIRSCYPVLTLWRANQPGESASVNLSAGAEHVVVMRKGRNAVLQAASPAVFGLIHCLQQGSTFLEACDSVLDCSDRGELISVFGSLIALSA